MNDKTDDETDKLTFIVGHILQTTLGLAISLAKLVSAEASLAKQSAGYICVFLLFLLPLLTISWLSILGILFIILYFLSLSWQAIIIILAAFNMLILISTIYLLIKLKNNLFFNATRKQLKLIFSCGENTSC